MTHNILGRMIDLALHDDDLDVAPSSFMRPLGLRPLGTFDHHGDACVHEEDVQTR